MYEKIECANKKCYNVNNARNKKNAVVAKLRSDYSKTTFSERMDEVIRFVKKTARLGYLDGYLSVDELDVAIHKGELPNRFNVHHYIPLSFGGNNQEDNLCIVDRRMHSFLHAYLLDKIYRDYRLDSSGKVTYLILPKKERVLTIDDAHLFFTDAEIKEFQQETSVPVLSKIEKPKHVDTRDMIFSLRLLDELRNGRVFDGPAAGEERKVQELIEKKIRDKNNEYKRKKNQTRLYWNERREGKVCERMGRKEKAELKAKKARRAESRRWYGNFIAAHYIVLNKNRENS